MSAGPLLALDLSHGIRAIRVAGTYLVASLLWIFLSDRLLGMLVTDPADWVRMQSVKGALFVCGSALLIYYLVRRALSAVAHSELARRQRDERFRALVENISDAVTVLHPDGTVAYVSPAFERITGYTAEERMGENAFARVHPDDLEMTRATFARLASTPGASATARPRIRHKDGSWRTVRLVGQNLVDNPAVGGLVVTYADVTMRMRVEERLRESEERFRLMVEGSEQVFFYEHDLEGRFLYLSPSVRNVMGYGPEELLGRRYGDLLTGDATDAEVLRQSEAALESGVRSEPYTALTRAHDGRTVALELIERPLVRNGAVIGLQGFARDITLRTAAEKRLRESEERFRSLIENSSDTVTVLDRRGVIRFQSSSVWHLLGFEPDALRGRAAARVLHPDDLDGVTAAFRALVADRAGTEALEFRCRDRGGDWRVIAATARNRLGDPTIGGIVVNARDVTASRVMEDQFRQAQKMEAVGRLAGGVAHDFNNILTAITGHVEMILTDLPASDDLRPDIVEIGKSAQRAATLTAQLLAFSRQQVLRPRVLDLNMVIEEMEGMLGRLIGEDIRVEAALQPDLCPIQADPGQIQQILMNLVVNARDAMPRGGKITLTTRDATISPEQAARFPYPVQPGAYALLAISDTGEGMDRQTLDQIFDPFFTTKAQGKGTGLGLSTVYGIVKQSGGYIWADSEPDVGTTFKVYLPRTETEPGPTSSAGSELADAAPTLPTGHSGTVLVVEDEPSVRELIRRILARAGYTTVEAATGKDALDRIATHEGPIDLVLTDVVMPEMGGAELGRLIGIARPTTAVLFMSGYTQDEVIRGGVVRSQVPFLQKPFSPDELLKAVGGALADVNALAI